MATIIPTLLAPKDAATSLKPPIALFWEASGVGDEPDGFNVYLDKVDGTTLENNGVGNTDTEYIPLELALNTTYYWTVSGLVGEVEGDKAEVQSFTTGSSRKENNPLDDTVFVKARKVVSV